ncbi:MAG: hypothetical protein U0872_06560 [Planctomycetaceae bacterium]
MSTVCLLVLSLTGCSLWHNLQPHRLHRLNQGPAPSLDPEFSRIEPWDGQPLFAVEESPAAPVIRAQSEDDQ